MTNSANVKIELIKQSYNQEKIVDIAQNDLNWHVRLAAVENIDDENILKDIANNDLTSAVAIKAMEHINDKEFLSDICLNHPDSYLRLTTINRICDESLLSKKELSLLLEEMLLNDPDSYILKSVCENPNLTNQDVLIKVSKSKSDETLKRQAIKKIADEEILTDFALNDSNDYIRREAILNPNLKDLDVLYKIIRSDSDEFNRIMAIYKIPDAESLLKIIYKKPLHNRLAEIAQNTNFSLNDYFTHVFETEKDEYKRQVAINFITDSDILENAVLNECNDEIRADAIKNKSFKSQEMLDELILNESNPKVLFEIVSKIQNQELLTRYVEDHLDYDEVTVKAISRLQNNVLLEKLTSHPESRIRFEAVKKISKLNNQDELLRDIALTEICEEICVVAVESMNIRNDLIEVADKRREKIIRIKALNQIKPKRLLDNFTGPIIRNSLADLPFEFALENMALNDRDDDIRKLATSKLDDEKLLYEISSGGDVNSIDAQIRLDSLFEDIKRIDNDFILKRLADCNDSEVSAMAQERLNDLTTWKSRIAEVNEINDINTLKDISQNDFNYLVRSEAEGKLEKILFHIRLDEIEDQSNQEKLKAIVSDEGFSYEIRKKALLKIKDECFIKKFEMLLG